MLSQLETCVLFCAFHFVAVFKIDNEVIINDFNSGQRSLLSIGLTPKRMVVLFGGQGIDDMYVYEMYKSALTPGARHMVTLSNGGLVSEKWPAFFSALKNKSSSHLMATVHDKQSEYFLVLFDRQTPLLYDMNAGKVKTLDVAAVHEILQNSEETLFSARQDRSLYSCKYDMQSGSVYTQYSIRTEDAITSANSKFSSKESFSFCVQSNDVNLTLVQTQPCPSQKNWTFSSGFTNETHFYLIGLQVAVVDNSNKMVTLLKREDFFGAGEDQEELSGLPTFTEGNANWFSKHGMLLVVIVGAVVFIGLLLITVCWTVYRFKMKKKKKRRHSQVKSIPTKASSKLHDHGQPETHHNKASARAHSHLHSRAYSAEPKPSHNQSRADAAPSRRPHTRRSSSRLHGASQVKKSSLAGGHSAQKNHVQRRQSTNLDVDIPSRLRNSKHHPSKVTSHRTKCSDANKVPETKTKSTYRTLVITQMNSDMAIHRPS